MKKFTSKQRVLRVHPKAYARYVGLSLVFVIVTDYRGAEISAYRMRERDAWSDAARKLKECK